MGSRGLRGSWEEGEGCLDVKLRELGRVRHCVVLRHRVLRN
jgi:hypothetical protein